MKNRLIFATLAIVLVYILNTLLFAYGIGTAEIDVSKASIFLFHGIASFVVLVGVEVLLKMIPNQAGMLYLALVFVKTGIFALVFKSSLFEKEQLEMAEKLLLIIPMFSYLIVEVVFLAWAMKATDKALNSEA
jgi:hypothetical protein